MQFYKYEFENWTYNSTFIVNDSILSKQTIELVFEGLDTHASIFLNN